MTFIEAVERVGTGVDCAGIAVIILGAAVAVVRYLARVLRDSDQAYRALRQNLGRAILIGLEFLVAGDIIKTIVVTPSGQHVAALAGVVAIRTFLSLSLTVEMTGRWPWQQKPEPATGSAP